MALGLDLGILHRRPHTIGLKEALIESATWISIALLFNLWVYFDRGPQAGTEFLTAYLVEKSLDVYKRQIWHTPGDASFISVPVVLGG